MQRPSHTAQSLVTARAKHSHQSLYQRCLTLLRKCRLGVPGFQEFVDEAQRVLLQQQQQQQQADIGAVSQQSPDPVTLLWTCFRYGTPLCLLMNHWRPGSIQDTAINPLTMVRENANLAKSNVYYFLLACRQVQPSLAGQTALFTISDLYRDDTNGFVKIVNTVESIVDSMQMEGLLSSSSSAHDDAGGLNASSHATAGITGASSSSGGSGGGQTISNRERVLTELLETERKYVADMERLQAYKHYLRDNNVIPQSAVRDLFCNVDRLADFQRKFLIAMEDTCQVPGQPHIGLLFTQNEEAFAVYGPYCANHQLAAETAVRLSETLQKHRDQMEPAHELPSYLIKPIQRICRYPLLLKELLKATDEQSPHRAELQAAYDASNRVAQTINEINRKQENAQIKRDLETKVEDWKGFNIREFGDLVLDANLIMARREIEKEVHMFLFERILICCKEIRKEKKKSLIRRSNSRTQIVSQFQLKGGVTITEIDHVVATSKNGGFEMKVYYKDYDTSEMENFTLKFLHEEPLKAWRAAIEQLLERQRRRSAASTKRNSRRRPSESNSNRSTGGNAVTDSPTRSQAEPPSPSRSAPNAATDRHSRERVTIDVTSATPPHSSPMSADAALSHRRSRASRGAMLEIVPEHQRSLGEGKLSVSTNVLPPRTYISPLHSPTHIMVEENRRRSRGRSGADTNRPDLLSSLDKAMNELELLQDEFLNNNDENEPRSTAREMTPPPRKVSSPSISTPPTSLLATRVYPPPTADPVESLATPSRRSRANTTQHGTARPVLVKTKIHVGNDIFILFLTSSIHYEEMLRRVAEKIDSGTDLVAAGQKPTTIIKKMTYQDEDGDFITIGSDEDVRVAMRLATIGMATDPNQTLSKRAINLYIEV